jgi:two-component system C4-dicarboxylate transport response regulator DctD
MVRLRIPPLRERRADIPQLFAHFVEEAVEQVGGGRFHLTDAVRRHLVDHDWPGNVRELRNFAFSAVLGLPQNGAAALPADAMTLPDRLARFEASIIRESLAATGGSVTAALKLLGVPRKTLYDKMARLGIDPAQFRKKA